MLWPNPHSQSLALIDIPSNIIRNVKNPEYLPADYSNPNHVKDSRSNTTACSLYFSNVRLH